MDKIGLKTKVWRLFAFALHFFDTCYTLNMLNDRKYTIETEQETDGRWLAEIVEIPGVMAYGDTPEQAQTSAKALALRVIAEEMEESANKNIFGFSSILFSLT